MMGVAGAGNARARETKMNKKRDIRGKERQKGHVRWLFLVFMGLLAVALLGTGDWDPQWSRGGISLEQLEGQVIMEAGRCTDLQKFMDRVDRWSLNDDTVELGMEVDLRADIGGEDFLLFPEPYRLEDLYREVNQMTLDLNEVEPGVQLAK